MVYIRTTRGPERVSVSPATGSYLPREPRGSLWFVQPILGVSACLNHDLSPQKGLYVNSQSDAVRTVAALQISKLTQSCRRACTFEGERGAFKRPKRYIHPIIATG